jgi:hypothetical protein
VRAGELRAAEDVDDLDALLGGDVLEPCVAALAEELGLGRVDGDHAVAVALQEAGNRVRRAPRVR